MRQGQNQTPYLQAPPLRIKAHRSVTKWPDNGTHCLNALISHTDKKAAGHLAAMLIALVLSITSPLLAAEFRLYPTCETPENAIEEAICGNSSAQKLHEQVARAYARLYRLMSESERQALELEHFDWLNGMYEACSGNLFNKQGASDLLDQVAASMRVDCVIFRAQARKDEMQAAYGSESFLENLSDRLVRRNNSADQAAGGDDPTSQHMSSRKSSEANQGEFLQTPQSSSETPSSQSDKDAQLSEIPEGLSEEEETLALIAEAERLVRLIEKENLRDAAASDPNAADRLPDLPKQPLANAGQTSEASRAQQPNPIRETRKPDQSQRLAAPDFADSAAVIGSLAHIGRTLHQRHTLTPSEAVKTALDSCLSQLRAVHSMQMSGYDRLNAKTRWETCAQSAGPFF